VLGLSKKSRYLDREALCDPDDVVERNVRLASFDGAHVGAMNAHGVREGFLREALGRSKSTDGTAELETERWHTPTVSRRRM
jgi:hypothetical protein